MLILVILATGSISALALVTFLFLGARTSLHQRLIMPLVALASGTMLGTALLYLLPESLEVAEARFVFPLVLLSFLLFFVLEKAFHWHCHTPEEHRRSLSLVNISTDAIHNFLDGIVIAAAFLTDPVVGFSATVAVALHELPQEIGDFGVLLHSGLSNRRALWINFLASLTVVLGGIVGYWFGSQLAFLNQYLLPMAAGGFLYLAASDLLPELRQTLSRRSSLVLTGLVLVGAGLSFVVGLAE